MAIETKEVIVNAVKTLLTQKKVRKLTVKDIVEESNITRQTFYYYFEDIPDLLKWILNRNTDKVLEETLAQGDAESGLHYLFLLALNVRPYVKRGLETNYEDEIKKMVEDYFFDFFMLVAEKRKLYPQCNHSDLKLIMKYHSQAVLGMIRNWSTDDNDDIEHIVHLVHQLVIGGLPPHPSPAQPH